MISPLLFLSNYLRINNNSAYHYISIITVVIVVTLLQKENLIQPLLEYLCNVLNICCFK